MIPVTPKVFFLGDFRLNLNNNGVTDWLKEIGGEEALDCLDHITGYDIEALTELLARRCYKSFAPGLNPNVTKVRTDSAEYHSNILKQRHGSVTAHGHCTYAFENVSRVFTHELVRNAVGNAFSQESLRYVRLDNIKFWLPMIIGREAKTKLMDVPPGWDSDVEKWRRMMTPTDIFAHVIATCEWAQQALAQYFDIDHITDFSQKKLLTSAFRRVAPEGLATGIGVTFSIRSLRWIIEQRTSRHAEEEIRLVFGMVAEDAIKRYPMLFQDFKKIDTNDGLHEYVPEHSKI